MFNLPPPPPRGTSLWPPAAYPPRVAELPAPPLWCGRMGLLLMNYNQILLAGHETIVYVTFGGLESAKPLYT